MNKYPNMLYLSNNGNVERNRADSLNRRCYNWKQTIPCPYLSHKAENSKRAYMN